MGTDPNPGECPLCGEQADFAVIQDATVTERIEIPEEATHIVGHYDPDGDYFTVSPGRVKYYYHFQFERNNRERDMENDP